jgi:peptide/nickel transport system substrate-binding protein
MCRRRHIGGPAGGVMNRARAVALVAVVALLAGACGGAGQSTQGSRGTHILRGGTLRVGLLRWNGRFPYDPTTFSDFELLSMYPCCLSRTLFYYNGHPAAEGGGVLRPDLATGLPQVSADGLTWTVQIRAGLHYGPPLQNVEITAPDFVRALERVFSAVPKEFQPALGTLGFGSDYLQAIQGASEYAEGKADSISGLEVVGPHTLRIHLAEPHGDLPYRLSLMSTAPIPPNPFNPVAKFGVAEGHARDGYGRVLVSSGPYMIEGSEKIDFSKPPARQQSPSGLDPLVLVRNPSWKGASDPLRPAYADRIEFVAYDHKPYTPLDYPFGDYTQKYRAVFARKVLAGSIDVMGDMGIPAAQVRRYETDPSLKRRLQVLQYHDVRFLTLNLAQPPFDDIHVRRAMNFVVNKKRIQEAWRPFDAAIIFDHLAPDSTENNLLGAYQPYRSVNHEGNVQAARREMRLSAYDRNKDGVCDGSACNLGTPLWRGDGANHVVANSVKTDLAKIGIRFSPKFVDPDQMYGACADPTKHAVLCQFGWAADYPSGSTFFGPLYSTQAFANGCCNFSLTGATSKQLRAWNYRVSSVPNLDQRLTACERAIGIDQVQCWVAFDAYLMQQVVPAIPLLIDAVPWTFSSRVTAFSWDQVSGTPALDQIALKPSA